MIKNKDFLVSVVSPVKEINEVTLRYLENLLQVLKTSYEQYEVVLVQDGISVKGEPSLISFVRGHEGCRVIKLMKTYGLDVAITAGLESAIGDVVVVCLPPFDPTDKIVEFINVARAGYIGLGQRPPGHYEGMWHSFAKKVFYVVVNRFLNFGLPSDTTYFVSLPRQAVTHIQRAKDRFRFLKVVTAQTGLPIQLLNYVPAEKDGRVYRTFWESILLSIDVVTSQSLTLLRFASLLSLFVSLGSLSYLIYAFNIFLFKSEVQKGWSSLSIFISACFFLLGLVFAILTEYLAKLFSESSNRPIYTIGNETVSDRVVANSHRANVLDTSKVD